MTYDVTVARSARRELERLPTDLSKRIVRRIERLGVDPRPDGVRKLQGDADLFRVRVGEYRVIYRVLDRRSIVDVIAFVIEATLIDDLPFLLVAPMITPSVAHRVAFARHGEADCASMAAGPPAPMALV